MPKSCDIATLNEQAEQIKADIRLRMSRRETDRQRAAPSKERLQYRSGPGDLEMLSKIGFDMTALEARATKAGDLLREDYERFMQAPPPEELGQRSIWQQSMKGLSGNKSFGYITEPAVWCMRSTEESDHVMCDPVLGQIKLKDVSQGLGGHLGWWAYGTPPALYATLGYTYFPESTGVLTVDPNVHVRGPVHVSSDDGIFSSSHAELRLNLVCSLFQGPNSIPGGLLGTTTVPVVHEYLENGDVQYWVDKIYHLSNTQTIRMTNFPVWICIHAELYAEGRSDYGDAYGDFLSGDDRFIDVKLIWTEFSPT